MNKSIHSPSLDILVHLTDAARSRAARALVRRGELAGEFVGPSFKKAQGFFTHDQNLHVTTEDGAIYIYPMRTIDRIRVTESK